MKVIFQEKDNPNSVGEFVILDREQLDKLEKSFSDFIVISETSQDFNRTLAENKRPYYNQGVHNPHNLGYPPSKIPSYSSEGTIKMADCKCIGCPCSTNKLKLCMYRMTYIWLYNGASFWFYPTYVSGTSISGWRWRNYRWDFFSMNVNKISNFYCYK